MKKPIMPKILNIAAGKLDPIGLEEYKHYFLINLDIMYYHALSPKEIEGNYKIWNHLAQTKYQCKADAFEFMERTSIMFDRIVCYRFLEHIEKTKVLYFIYLMSTCLKIGGVVDCIVPNYHTLAKMIMTEDLPNPDFEQRDILLTYELLNEPFSPHASIWTPQRVWHFFGLEGRFEINSIEPAYNFDGRDIYIRFLAERIK